MILVLATQNQDKVKEIRTLFEGKLDLKLTTLADYPELKLPPETGDTYRDNAIEKALFVAMETGHVALGDDSGLEVDALEGAPGVYSARFAGEGVSDVDNRAKLLRVLKGVPEIERGAQFVCTMAIVTPEGQVDVVDGVCDGKITVSESGQAGFGYDPIFFYPPLGKTFSEMHSEEKNQISHRGLALRAAIPVLNGLLMQKG